MESRREGLFLELESEAVVSHLVWELGIELRSLEEQEVLLTTELFLQSSNN